MNMKTLEKNKVTNISQFSGQVCLQPRWFLHLVETDVHHISMPLLSARVLFFCPGKVLVDNECAGSAFLACATRAHWILVMLITAQSVLYTQELLAVTAGGTRFSSPEHSNRFVHWIGLFCILYQNDCTLNICWHSRPSENPLIFIPKDKIQFGTVVAWRVDKICVC